MPTIDELTPVTVSADTDELPIYQGGQTLKVTRAQLLANAQPQILATPGTLLGRVSTGVGNPETVTLGPTLSMTNGQLSAAVPPTMLATLPAGRMPTANDLVPLAQSGLNAGVGYGTFMSGLAALSGINLSQQSVTPTGGMIARKLGDAMGDIVSVEAFGAMGDGVTDDTAAIQAALNSGKPVRFGARTYILNGPFSVARSAAWIGVLGQTVIRRLKQSGSAAPWISVTGPGFNCVGINFDANGSIVTVEGPVLSLGASCISTIFTDCVFTNAAGPTYGCGLTYQSSDPAVTQHLLRNCRMRGNAAHGAWVQGVAGVQVMQCVSHDNAGHGIMVDYQDPTLVQKAMMTQLISNECWNNQRGISIGNTAIAGGAPGYVLANPDAIGALVVANSCHDNSAAGIAAAGSAIAVTGNLLANNGGSMGAGIVIACSASLVSSNVVSSGGEYGIDARGSVDLDIARNHVTGVAIGIDASSGQRVRIDANTLLECGWAINIANVGTSSQGGSLGGNYGQAANIVTVTGNAITIGAPTGGGIMLTDAPQAVLVARNAFTGINGAGIGQALTAQTDSVVIEGNRWNNAPGFTINPVSAGGTQQMQVPDIADAVTIASAPSGVQSILTLGQIATAGGIAFIKVTNGGSGYTNASVVIGGAGNGASAIPLIAGGAIIGILLTAPGSGYGGIAASAPVTITGNGGGATAIAAVGIPLWNEKRLRITCNVAVTFAHAGASPPQDNWTGYAVTVPANATVEWAANAGRWRAVAFPGGDYFAPGGDGSFALRTLAGGNLTLHPSGAGQLRIATDTDPGGYASCVGHGSPQNVVTAPPGSDYRNLDGGVGATLWIKQTGTGTAGWAAIA